jgi:PAS domain S-box-containing protein
MNHGSSKVLSLDFYKHLIDNLSVGVLYLTDKGIVTFFSNAAMNLLHLEPEEGIGRHVIDFIAEERHELFRRRAADTKAGILLKPHEYILKRLDGSKFEALVTTHTQYNAQGKPESYFITIQDNTEKKKIENALKHSEQKFRSTFENAGIPMSVCDKKGAFTLFNPAVVKLTGYSESELSRMSIKEISHPEDYIVEKKQYDSLMRGEIESFIIEKRYIKKNGNIAWARVTTSLVRDENGIPLSAIRMLEDVTERVIAERDLKESERRLSTLIGNLPGTVFRQKNDKTLTAEYVSGGFYQLTGYHPEDFLQNKALTFSDITYPEDREMVFNEIGKALKKKQRYSIVYRIITASGKLKWILEQGFGVCAEDGSVHSIEGFATDVSDKMELMNALRDSEQKFRLLVENMRDGLYVVDLQGNLQYANNMVYSIMGLGSGDDIKHINNNFLDKTTLYKLKEERHKIFEGKVKNAWIEIPARKINGDEIWLEIRVLPIYDGNGTLTSFQNIMRDITERKIAEEKLRASELRFRSYFELPLIGIVILSAEWNILDCNNKTALILGFTKKKLKEMTLIELTHPDDVSIPARIKPMLNNSVNDYTFTQRFIKSDGTVVYVEIALGGIKRPDGSTAFWVAVINDITEKTVLAEELEKHRNHLEQLVKERTLELANVNSLLHAEIKKQKEAEKKVKAALEREKELSELKSRFISIASHEFRTPLTTIYSSTQLLERFGRKWDDAMYKNQIDRIKEQVHHLTDTMDDVLIIGRTESGKIKYEPQMVDLKAFCDNLLEDIRPLISEKHKFSYKFMLKQNIYLLDEKLLKYIFLNLLTNAIKYSPNGGKIEFIIKGRRKEIEFIVSDKGIGIPEKNRSILFEPFHRCDNVGDISGTGLGMSIIIRSVEMHKGLLSFVSKENKGTTFRVLIPKEK